jgi:DNA polymerase-1
MPPERISVFLIDASSYIYRAFHALPPLTSPDGLPTNAVYGFTTMLLKLLRDSNARYVAAVFDSPGRTFRDDLFDAYKANREGMPDELAAQLPLIRDVLNTLRIHQISVPGVEADDVIGTLARRLVDGVDIVIVTGDKDLMQLVGPHVRIWDTMRDRWFDEDAVRARWGVPPDRVVEVMGLMGDSIDNIPGVRGIGEKTAKLLIERYGTIDALLSRIDEVEATKEIRGARKIAAALREHADAARLSRRLASIRCDVEVACDLEQLRLTDAFGPETRDLFARLGFQSLARDVTTSAAPVQYEVRQLGDAGEVARWCELARSSEYVALAVEREADAPRGPAHGLVLKDPHSSAVRLGVAPPGALPSPLRELLSGAKPRLIAHDLKRDLLALDAATVDRAADAFDVMVAAYLLEIPSPERLESVAMNVLGERLELFRGGVAALGNGVSLLHRLQERCAQQLEAHALKRLFEEVEMPLVGVLTAMERRGVHLDAMLLRQMNEEVTQRLSALVDEIYEQAGGEFNISSPPQLRDVLFERLKLSRKGVRRGKTGLSTDVDVLTRLAAEHPLPAKILEHRMLAKLKSTYIEALPAAVDAATGRLHTSFNQTVAATGRLSSSDPNLQNIPIRGEEGRRIRAAFRAADGCVLIGADYSQIELRLLAHFSRDPALVGAFRSGEDVHARTAAEVFGVLPGMVSAEMRRTAKVINFGILYGMGPQRLSRELGIALSAAEGYIRSYFERYAGVRNYMENVRLQAKQVGYVTTLLGRRRSFPDISSRDRALAQAAERMAINTPIQGSAADLIKLAMVAIHRRLRQAKLAGELILQVHDELLVEVVERDVEAARAIVQQEMEGAYPLEVPLRVEVGVGHNWAEIH